MDFILDWLGGNWSTIGLLGLAGFALMMLKSMIKSSAPPEPATSRSESHSAAASSSPSSVLLAAGNLP